MYIDQELKADLTQRNVKMYEHTFVCGTRKKSVRTHHIRMLINLPCVGKTNEYWVKVWDVLNRDDGKNSAREERGFQKITFPPTILLQTHKENC